MTNSQKNDMQILLVEMQPSIVDACKTMDASRMRRSAAALREIARVAHIPITATVVALGERPPQLIDELSDLVPLVRSTVSPFGDGAVVERLRASKRNTLLLGGVSSEIAVLHAALDAVSAGFSVHLLADLCGGLDARSERASLERMGRVGVVPSSLSSFATTLFDDMRTELGRTIMQTLDRYWSWGVHEARTVEASPSQMDDEIGKLLQQLSDAWRCGDADGFARRFSEGARFVAARATHRRT